MKNEIISKKLKSDFTKVSGVWLIYLCVSLGIGILLGMLMLMNQNPSYQLMISYALSAGCTFLVYWIARKWLMPKERIDSGKYHLDSAKFIKYSLMTLGISIVVSFFTSVLNVVWNLLWDTDISSYDLGLGYSFQDKVMIFLFVGILAPIAEELLFRGVILRKMDQYNRVFAILISGLLFGMLHLNLVQFFPTFFIGCFWGYISLKEDSMAYPIALHIMNNVISLMSSYYLSNATWSFIYLICIICGVYFCSKEIPEIKHLIYKEKSDYRYGELFFSRWTSIVALVIFFLIAVLG